VTELSHRIALAYGVWLQRDGTLILIPQLSATVKLVATTTALGPLMNTRTLSDAVSGRAMTAVPVFATTVTLALVTRTLPSGTFLTACMLTEYREGYQQAGRPGLGSYPRRL
jgi:hypothetical protein